MESQSFLAHHDVETSNFRYPARMDHLSARKRSQLMSRIRGRNTKPERAVRSLVHRMGFRFRLHSADLPGRPDLVFRSRRKVIFVHGCFWHQHSCKRGTRPKTNRAFWAEKLERNRARDEDVATELGRLGWRSLVVWECQTLKEELLCKRLRRFLEGGTQQAGITRRRAVRTSSKPTR